MGRFARSWELTKTSFRVIKEEKELLVFPILSIIFSVILVLFLVVPYLLSFVGYSLGIKGFGIFYFFMIFIVYFGIAFISTFFNFCTVYTAATKFSKKNPTFISTIKYAFSKSHLILAWSVVAATVGLILSMIENAAKKIKGVGGFAVNIVGFILGVAWSIATIFVIPVIVYENVGPFTAIKNSALTIKKTWGELLIKWVGLGLASFVVSFSIIFVTVVLAVLGFLINIWLMIFFIITGIIALIISILIFSAATKVFDTALYVYAKTGVVVGGYSKQDLKEAFISKNKI